MIIQWPYTNLHELNLDWVLEEIQRLSAACAKNANDKTNAYNIFFTSDYMSSYGDDMIQDIVAKANGNPALLCVDYDSTFRGGYTIPGNISIVPCGGVLRSNATLTIDGFIFPAKIPTFDAPIIANGEKNPVGYPEMFSSESIQDAVNGFASVELSAKSYHITDPIVINRSGFHLRGVGAWAANGTASRIIVTNSSSPAIIIDSPSGDAGQIESVALENLSVEYQTAADQYVRSVQLKNCAHSSINNVSVYNGCDSFFISRTVNTHVSRCMVINSVQSASFPAIGFHLGEGGAPYGGFVGENASLFIERCTYIGNDFNKAGIGVMCHSAVSDVFIDEFEFSAGNIGIKFDGTAGSNTANNNIHIRNCVIERYATNGVELANLIHGQCLVQNSYFAPYAAPENYTAGISMNNCAGCFTLADNNFIFSYSTEWSDKLRGIILVHCNGVDLHGNCFKDAHTCIYCESCISIKSNDNAYNSANPSASAAFNFNSCQNVFIAPTMLAVPAYGTAVNFTTSGRVFVNITNIATGAAGNNVMVDGAPVASGSVSGTIEVIGQ